MCTYYTLVRVYLYTHDQVRMHLINYPVHWIFTCYVYWFVDFFKSRLIVRVRFAKIATCDSLQSFPWTHFGVNKWSTWDLLEFIFLWYSSSIFSIHAYEIVFNRSHEYWLCLLYIVYHLTMRLCIIFWLIADLRDWKGRHT